MRSPAEPLSPRTALALPELGYGAANVGNLFRELSDAQAHAVLEAAWNAGVRYFDTAPHYGLGTSERRLGAFLRTKPREDFVVSTKAGRLLVPNPGGEGELDLDNDFHVPATVRREWDFTVSGIRRSVEESLERMGLDRVDLVYLHDPERAAGPNAFGTTEALLETGAAGLDALKADGTIAASGVGSMTTETLEASAASGAFDALMIAGRLTLLEQPALDTVVPACERTGTGIVTASVFNSGLLATDDPSRGGRYEYGQAPDDVMARAMRIAETCRAHGVPLPAAALQYTLRFAPVRAVVAGSSRPEQIRQNAEWMGLEIPAALWADLTEQALIP